MHFAHIFKIELLIIPEKARGIRSLIYLIVSCYSPVALVLPSECRHFVVHSKLCLRQSKPEYIDFLFSDRVAEQQHT